MFFLMRVNELYMVCGLYCLYQQVENLQQFAAKSDSGTLQGGVPPSKTVVHLPIFQYSTHVVSHVSVFHSTP